MAAIPVFRAVRLAFGIMVGVISLMTAVSMLIAVAGTGATTAISITAFDLRSSFGLPTLLFEPVE